MKSKICIVGLGYWGSILVRNFNSLKNVKLYICDKDKEKVVKIAQTYKDVQIMDSYEDVLTSDIDSVVLAVNPLSTHYPMAKQALEHKKHVWLEKPMTSTSKEAEELIQLAKDNNVILHVDHTFEYSPHVRHVKKVLDNGELGDILYVSLDRQNLGLYQQDYDVIWDLCPHDFSILNYWFGKEPEHIHILESCKSFNFTDIGTLHLKYDKFDADMRISWRHPEKVRKTIIIGSKKMLVYDDVGPNKIFIHDIRIDKINDEYKYTKNLSKMAEYYKEWEPLQEESSHFVECIQKNVPTLTPGESGLRVMRLLERCQ